MVSEGGCSRVILIPIDGSDHCDRAFRWYLENMKRDTDCIKFVHVVEPIYNTPPFGITTDPYPIPDMTQIMEGSIKSVLYKLDCDWQVESRTSVSSYLGLIGWMHLHPNVDVHTGLGTQSFSCRTPPSSGERGGVLHETD
ncbi:hypothetical protein MN116_006093 [Schistosoma mekongi]|uniref:UspA domain-containing protein n=1 Tax=Schistosoma mekongi TaxID=38744 RepID=A0AAE1ZB63_SCHME|nr:hypothetical protein MN116_006093 [Schistosoma mekongi]